MGSLNPPHFHVEFQGEKATFTFDGRLRSGNISSGTARKLVRDWARRHRLELMINCKNIVVGPNLKQAAVTAIYLEETAKLTYRSRCIGTPIGFTDEEVARLLDYIPKENSFNRAWDYYVGRLPESK